MPIMRHGTTSQHVREQQILESADGATVLHLAGARQATRLRQQYLQAVLRQEPAFFDLHVKSGDLLQGLNEDTSAIQLAIGEKVHCKPHDHLATVAAANINKDIQVVMIGILAQRRPASEV